MSEGGREGRTEGCTGAQKVAATAMPTMPAARPLKSENSSYRPGSSAQRPSPVHKIRLVMLVQGALGLFGNLRQAAGSCLPTVYVVGLDLFGSSGSSALRVSGTFSSWPSPFGFS